MQKKEVNKSTEPFRIVMLFLFDPSDQILHLPGNVKIAKYSYLRKRLKYILLYKYPYWLEVLKTSGIIVDYISTKTELAVRFPAIPLSQDPQLHRSIPEIVVEYMRKGNQ